MDACVDDVAYFLLERLIVDIRTYLGVNLGEARLQTALARPHYMHNLPLNLEKLTQLASAGTLL